MDERPGDFDERDFDELEPAFGFEALPREPELLVFAEFREPAAFPRADPVLEVFEPREALLAFAFPEVPEDLSAARWDLL